ncbi:MAG: transcriptional regulator, MerR family [Ilumatobacteraceae bacterium]|nr:transcriptional regulator, MerR family [Ilumatobacteraceae bacterium]
MTIGELASRLRVTTRTLRHYEQLGLLMPEKSHPDGGYRRYGEPQLVRGMQIEQLKRTGLSLALIKRLLDGEEVAGHLLKRRRREIETAMAVHEQQLSAVDALLADHAELADPHLVTLAAGDALLVNLTCAQRAMDRTIRTGIQRMRRDIKQRDDVVCGSFSARFPLNIERASLPVEISVRVSSQTPGSVFEAAETAMKVLLIGDLTLLPLAYDLALTAVRERGLQPTGWAIERYLDLGRSPRTEVMIPIRPPVLVAGRE